MHIDIHNFIRSLKEDRLCLENPVVPDGVINVSHLVEPLFAITRNGRALASDVEYDHARFLGELLGSLVPLEASNDHRDHAIIVISLLLLRAIDTAVTIHGDTTTEEILMMAADCHELDSLRRDMSALPCYLHPDGSTAPNFASLPMLSRARPITAAMLKGFVKRHFRPTLPHLFTDPEEVEDYLDHDEASFDFEYVDASTIEGDDVDPLSGFDEFERHFFNHQYKAYEAGASLDELDDIDDDGE